VGQKCNCGGEIVPKMASCPICNGNTHIEHLGKNCPKCNVPLRMEG
jgi:Zn finger protein HypA/HybF involved in hydrogenase expression